MCILIKKNLKTKNTDSPDLSLEWTFNIGEKNQGFLWELEIARLRKVKEQTGHRGIKGEARSYTERRRTGA